MLPLKHSFNQQVDYISRLAEVDSDQSGDPDLTEFPLWRLRMLELFNIWLILLWAALPCTAWLLRFFIRRRIHGFILYIITLVIGYFLFVGCAWLSDVVLEQRMNSFDLDGDGGIGGDEMTAEAQKAMDDWASDTGRTLAIFIGLPLTAIWSAICLIPLCFCEWIVRRMARRKPEESPSEVVSRPTEDGNPYMPPGS